MDLLNAIDPLLDLAIAEDIRSGDVTIQACLPKACTTEAHFILKQAGIIAGLPILERFFKKIDPLIQLKPLFHEGSFHKTGTTIAKLFGPAGGILTGERIALNLIQHASGVATLTAAYVRKLKGLNCVIQDTRKTLPGLRALEKYAVIVGGGVNHRLGLDDRFIIKPGLLYFLKKDYANPIKEAINRARNFRPDLPIEVEIDNQSQLKDVLASDATVVMLNKMSPDEIAWCVKKTRKTSKKIYVGSAGAITLDTIRAYAETGVDGICVGALTYSVPGLDIRMRLN